MQRQTAKSPEGHKKHRFWPFFFLSAALHIFEEPCWQFTCQICLLCKSRFFILFIFLIYNLARLKTQVYLFKSNMTTCETSHERYRRCNTQIKWSALWLSFFSFYYSCTSQSCNTSCLEDCSRFTLIKNGFRCPVYRSGKFFIAESGC